MCSFGSGIAVLPYILLLVSGRLLETVKPFCVSQFQVHESMRISTTTSHDYVLPVFIYARLGYRDELLFFLSKSSRTY
ncbi:Hyaluronidase-4 [Manis pentadactyla]|nr:Hyaluronidase-4 [Manis pentadactyla]